MISVYIRTGCIRKVMDSPTGCRPFGGVPQLGRMRDSISIFLSRTERKIMVSSPSSRGRATVHRTVAFKLFESRIRWQKEKPHPLGVAFFLAEDEGFEPPQTESESGVLPLHKSSMCLARVSLYSHTEKSQEVFSCFCRKFYFFCKHSISH